MELQQLEVGDALVRVTLIGSLDYVGVGQVEAKFLACTVSRGKHTIVDMSQVNFISSVAMAMFVTGYKGLQRQGAKLVLLKPQPDVLMALEIARLTGMLVITQDDAEAQRILGIDQLAG